MGSDEFGAVIMLHPPEPATKNQPAQWAQARISNVEITHAGMLSVPNEILLY